MHGFGGLGGREPLHFALALFRPSLLLTSYLEWKDVNFTNNNLPPL